MDFCLQLTEPAELTVEAVVITLFLLGVPLYPIAWYLDRGWEWRKLSVVRGLRREAKDEYLAFFQRQPRQVQTADARFEDFYLRWYGRRHIVIPAVFLAVCLALVCWLLGAFALSFLFPKSFPADVLILPPIASAAIAGAYVFTSFDLIERVARRDLSPNDLCMAVFRLLIAIPLGYVIQPLAAEKAGELLAFSISAFPFGAVAEGLRKLGARRLGLDEGMDNAGDRITLLAGVDLTIAERVREADIVTITGLAYADPIQLAMRTNLGFNFCVDLVSQALAWVYFGKKLDTLRAFGLRGAFEIVALQNDLFRRHPNLTPEMRAYRQAVARRLVADAAAHVQLSRAEFLNAVHQIADDPYSCFLLTIYA